MAIAVNVLTGGASTTDGTAFSTASISPTGDALILACVTTFDGDSAPGSLTVTGNGLTWVQVATVSPVSQHQTYVYRAMGSSPSSGAVTFTWSATVVRAAWSIVEFTGVDTSGTNGSGAVVQSATNSGTDTGTNSITATLAAFGNAANATYGGFSAFIGGTGGVTFTEGSGFTLGTTGSANENGISQGCVAEYKLSNDTSVDVSWGGTTNANGYAAIGVEVKAAATTAKPKLIIS